MVSRLDSTAGRRVIRNDGLPLQSGWLLKLGVAHLAVFHALSLRPAETEKQVLTDCYIYYAVCMANAVQLLHRQAAPYGYVCIIQAGCMELNKVLSSWTVQKGS